MNDLNLQNPEFLFYVNRANVRSPNEIRVAVQIGNEVVVLVTVNHILDNCQIWNFAHLLDRYDMVSFKDLNNFVVDF